MFRGNHPTRVDEKGRLKVPADFKRELDEKYGPEFYITSMDGKIAKVYPLKEWEKIEQLMLTNPSEEMEKFQRQTSFWGQVVEIDGQGRLLIPSTLREKAELKGDVAVVGVLNHLEVQLMADYLQQIEQDRITPDEKKSLKSLGIW